MVAGATALFRRSDYAPSRLIPSIIRHQSSKIGVIENSAGSFFAERPCLNATIHSYPDLKSAVSALHRKQVKEVNEILVRWRADGTGTDVLQNWFPQIGD
jgi:hypothetical protein